MKGQTITRMLGAILAVYLLQGCGGGGGSSSSSSAPVVTTPTPGLAANRTTKKEPSVWKYDSEYKDYDPSRIPFEHLAKKAPFNDEKLSQDKKAKLKGAYYQAINAYIKNGQKNSPRLDDLIRARLLSNAGIQGPAKERAYKVGEDQQFSYQQMLTAIQDVTELCNQKKVGPTLGDPNFISNQTYLAKVADHGWRTHNTTIAQIRHLNNTLQNGGKLEENSPMVADASHSQPVFTGLKDDHWYLYGQSYAFKGHWEPEEGLRQEYRGQGAEFGAFRSMGNGFLLGGMFGLQKVSMEADLGETGKMESDAQIYRLGPFVSWSNDRWTVDSMLTYGWVSFDTSRRDILNSQWKGSPKGSEWAAHLQTSYKIPLDNWTMGLSLVPEAYVGYRMGTIEEYREKNGVFNNTIGESKHKGLTTRLGTGIGYVFPDLNSPTDIMFRLGVQKTHGWQDKGKSSSNAPPKTPVPESRDTAMYYSLGLNHQFGVDLDKMVGFEYSGTSGKKSGSDALTLTYRMKF